MNIPLKELSSNNYQGLIQMKFEKFKVQYDRITSEFTAFCFKSVGNFVALIKVPVSSYATAITVITDNSSGLFTCSTAFDKDFHPKRSFR